MLDQEVRRRIILQQEGAVLASISGYTTPVACEIARCQIDGIANALVRIDGAEETAHFIFALSDRVAGGLRDDTDYVSPLMIEASPVRIDNDDPPPLPAVRQKRGPDFAYGFLCGCAAMYVITILAWGRL